MRRRSSIDGMTPMSGMMRVTTAILERIGEVLGVVRTATAGARDDRGDVPGWVLITLMTAGLVVLIWALAGPALTQVFEQAMDSVTGISP
jgi:hypothetical protein